MWPVRLTILTVLSWKMVALNEVTGFLFTQIWKICFTRGAGKIQDAWNASWIFLLMNQVRKKFLVCLRRPQESKLRSRSNKPAGLLPTPQNIMDNQQKRQTTLSISKRLRTQVLKPSHYRCPEGPAFIEAARKGIRIWVLLDSGSNIFLINKDLVEHFDIPYATCQKALNILPFDGEVH